MDWYEVSASAHQTEYKTDFGKPNFLFTQAFEHCANKESSLAEIYDEVSLRYVI